MTAALKWSSVIFIGPGPPALRLGIVVAAVILVVPGAPAPGSVFIVVIIVPPAAGPGPVVAAPGLLHGVDELLTDTLERDALVCDLAGADRGGPQQDDGHDNP